MYFELWDGPQDSELKELTACIPQLALNYPVYPTLKTPARPEAFPATAAHTDLSLLWTSAEFRSVYQTI